MKRTATVLGLFIVLMVSTILAQEVYTNDKVEYSFEIPSPTWKAVTDPEATRVEFVYGDRLDGYLQVRREVVDAGTTVAQLAHRDSDVNLRFLPGFVEGKQEPFNGRLDGVTMSYEFIRTGKPMLGRIYYLKADPRTVYTLRFTGLRDKLARIRNQTDLIARTFKLK